MNETPNRPSAPAGQSGIYRAILWLMVADVLLGVGLALGGDYLWHNQAVATAGTWLAVVGGALYLFFRWWGKRQGLGGVGGEKPDR